MSTGLVDRLLSQLPSELLAFPFTQGALDAGATPSELLLAYTRAPGVFGYYVNLRARGVSKEDVTGVLAQGAYTLELYVKLLSKYPCPHEYFLTLLEQGVLYETVWALDQGIQMTDIQIATTLARSYDQRPRDAVGCLSLGADLNDLFYFCKESLNLTTVLHGLGAGSPSGNLKAAHAEGIRLSDYTYAIEKGLYHSEILAVHANQGDIIHNAISYHNRLYTSRRF